ncbi:MAG: NCS2 family permease [Paludibacteraceae bacterium]|nr:NCS2 family permease [Paludibacteraceae bacterium]
MKKSSLLKTLFGFNPKEHKVKTEIMAGLTTFFTMAYILAVNPEILAATGMDEGAVFTVTVIISALSTLLMAFYAKLPFALAPGMGLNAFFAYTICISMGYSWQMALTAVLMEGIIFILLTLTNLREKIVYSIPKSLHIAIGAGIGLFILFLGMQSAELIVRDEATMVKLGNITSGPALLCCIGLIVTATLMYKKVPGAMLYGIILTTLIGIPMGVTQYTGIFSLPPSPESIIFKFDISFLGTMDFWIVVFTLLFVDMFDTIGTLLGVAQHASMVDEKTGKMPWIKKAFMVDAISTTTGAMLGSSTVTTFVESTSGIAAGGRTGLTAFTVACCFIVSLFLSPIFVAMPGAATGPALILVGFMMMSSMSKIDFSDYSEGIPSVLCITLMAFSCSIANGIAMGLISYVGIKVFTGKAKKVPIPTYILTALFILKYIV